MINPFIFLQFDSIGVFFGLSIATVQVMPFIAFISMLFFIFIWFFKDNLRIPISEIVAILLILAYLILLSIIEIFSNNWSSYYINGFYRQTISLIVFFIMYFMFRLISNDYRYIFYGIYLGIFLLLPLSVFQIFEFAISSKRLSGFSSEPSHFGHFLVFALIPAIMILKNRIKFYRVLFIYSNILVLSTLSVTAIFQLLILYAAVFLNFNFKNLMVFFCLIALILIFIFALPDSYLFSNLKFFSSLQSFEDGMLISASLADRYYSLFAPIQGLGSSISIFGNGIASDYYYFNDLVPYPANELIADSRSGYVGFSSFFGKAVCWGGIPIIFILTSVFVSTYKNANKEVRRYIIPVIVGAFYSLGSLATPYICLWFAILRVSSLTEKV